MSATSQRTGLALAFLLCAGSAQASVEISAAATKHMHCAKGLCSPKSKRAVLNITDLTNMLANEDVEITTGAGAVTITVFSPFSWTSTHRLTLDAYETVSFRAPVTVAGTGAVTIVTNDGGTGGDLRFFGKGQLQFWDRHSGLIINGNAYYLIRSIEDFLLALGGHEGTGEFFALQKNADSKTPYSGSPIQKKFNGTFEGLGNAISHLEITGEGDVGLFAQIKPRGNIRDLYLKDVNINIGTDGHFVGALAGLNRGTVRNCFASGQIGSGGGFEGGLIGMNGGPITNSSSAVVVSIRGYGTVAGGLVGANEGKIKQSYATGTVTGNDYVQTAGGLIGREAGYGGSTISDSYATGATTGGGITALVGGLVGQLIASPILRNAYSIGAVGGGTDATVGGLIGEDTDESIISTTYWDLDTSNISDPHQGAGNIPDDPGITGLTDAQLKSGLPAGFDPNTWAQRASINNGYPYLIANPPPE